MEDFVTFEIAKKLKEKGFREECLLHYTDTGFLFCNSIDTYDRPNQELDYSDFRKCFNNGNSIGLVDAPTLSQALKWFREEKIYIVPTFCVDQNDSGYWDFRLISTMDGMLIYDEIKNRYNSYEQAALAGIEYVLNNLI